MPSLTDDFRQLVDKHERAHPPADPARVAHKVIDDTFVPECSVLYQQLLRLDEYIGQVRSAYLLAQHSGKHQGLTLTDTDREEIDREMNSQLQAMLAKLKFLRNYELKRAERSGAKTNGVLFLDRFLGTSDDDVFETTMALFRGNVLVFLTEALSGVLARSSQMQQRRLEREQQTRLSNFQEVQGSVPVARHTHTEHELDSAQVQVLQQENTELLEQKTSDLAKVRAIEKTLGEVNQLQLDLGLTLNVQTQQINVLRETQEEMERDMSGGHRELERAGKRNKTTAQMVVRACYALGITLVVLDFLV